MPPLDLVWLWQNQSDAMYIQSLRTSSPGTYMESPAIETLHFSLRSGQRHLGSGFGEIAIVTPDIATQADSKRPGSSASDKDKLLHSFTLLKQMRHLLLGDETRNSTVQRAASRLSEATRGLSDLAGSIKAFVPHRLTFSDEAGNVRHAQRPAWLSDKKKDQPIAVVGMWQLACQSHLEGRHTDSDIDATKPRRGYLRRLHPMRRVFGKSRHAREDDATLWTVVASYACKQKSLPTFNPSVMRSVAADYNSQSGAFILLEKHHFFGSSLDSSHFFSPLFGPIFRLSKVGIGEHEVMDNPSENSRARSQASANILLGNRFGHRGRSRSLDLPSVIMKDVLQEVRTVWRKELLQSHMHRTSANSDIDTAFLYMHYTVERHREALLWSFFVAKHDTNGDNKYSSKELTRLLADLGFTFDTVPRTGGKEPTPVYFPLHPRSITPIQYQKMHEDAGLWRPTLNTVTFTSQHGYLGTRDTVGEKTAKKDHVLLEEQQVSNASQSAPKSKRVACKFSSVCFAPLFDKAADGLVQPTTLFKHMAFGHWGCGDCVLHTLFGRGDQSSLAPFLPTPELHFPAIQTALSESESTTPRLSTKSRFETIDYSLEGVAQEANQATKSRLEFVSSLLTRYQYAVSNTDEDRTIGIFRDETPDRSLLLELEKTAPPMFSLSNQAKKRRRRIDHTILAWLSIQFSEPIEYERQ